jgi:hypothetical protein
VSVTDQPLTDPEAAAARAMTRLNRLFVATSLAVLLVTVERFSFTTEILLSPWNFLRLHELVQMTAIILTTVVIQALTLRELSRGFSTLTVGPFLLFVVGAYYYATGNGVHELGSFTFHAHCDVDTPAGDLCGGLYVNDYYTGNIMFFVGALLTTTALLVLARRNPLAADFGTRALVLVLVNAAVYALAIVAYAGFDRVLVGLVFTVVMDVVALAFLGSVGRRYRRYPFIVYTSAVFTLGAVAGVLVRVL